MSNNLREEHHEKNHCSCFLALVFASVMTGCPAMAAALVTGFLYTDVSVPLLAIFNATYSKTKTAMCSSILGIIGTGDASIETAMKNGGITKVHHIDYKSTNILGINATFTITVYGD